MNYKHPKKYKGIRSNEIEDSMKGAKEDIDDLIRKGAEEVEKAKTGKWIHRNDDFNDWFECSECGYGSDGEVKYGEETPCCCMCGAKLEVEK